jgi:hypothetical protein
MRKNHVWPAQILISLVSASALAQSPHLSPAPPLRSANTPPVTLGVIVPMINNTNTLFYDPDDRRFYNPRRNEPNFDDLKAPPRGYHYELREGQAVLVRN